MPLVFVHGVSNRDNPEYRDNQLARDAFFLALVAPKLGLDGDKVQIFNPYWGDAGVKFRWGNASLPEAFKSLETFGTALDPADLRIGAEVVATSSPDSADIVAVANRSLSDAIDIVWSAALPATATAKEAAALAESYKRALDYATVNPNPDWLNQANNDNFVRLTASPCQKPPRGDGAHCPRRGGAMGKLWDRRVPG